ncbi:MAG: DEAD/DEAH box helicase [Thermoproteota archaeon]|nr:DEAD/DEAH box helicase [Thermoproteota archaeon]
MKWKMTKTFEELGLSAQLTKALTENGFKAPFPIQETAIPLILQGKDVVGQAHTGTGKTAAFGLPILQQIKPGGPVQVLILAPTRELAVQVTDEINRFAKYTGIKSVTIYGGQSINLQLDKLRRGVQIVVATPGRLIDHIKQGSIILDDVRFVVLDEADRMLDMGFIDDIKFILFYVNEDRQTCLFSATMPPEILRLADEYMRQNKVEQVRLNEEEITLETIDQSYLVVEEREKFKHLTDFIRRNQNAKSQTIVFAATKQRADRLAYKLRQEGFSAVTIHGDLSQKQRDNAMHRFKRGAEDILVATDIAARGIDVPAIGNVINYDVPEDPNIYFHRIGRTARAWGEGNAISLVSNDRVSDFERILAQTKLPIRKLNDELGIVVPVIAQRQASFGRSGGYRWRGGYGSRSGYRNERSGGGGQRRYGSGGGRGGYGGYGHSRSQTGYGRDRRRSRYGYSGSSSSNNY